MDPTANNSTCIIVFKSTQNDNSSDQHWQSPNIISTERFTTKLDYELGFYGGKIAIKCHDFQDTWDAYNNNLYSSGTPNIATVTRAMDADANAPSSINIYMNALSDINTFSSGTSYTLNSWDFTNDGYYTGFVIGASVWSDLSNFNSGTAFDGDIAEIIVYDAVLNASQLKQIHSYLAIKYGITLDQSVGYDYLRSDGTVIWNASAFGVYKRDIAGIGQDNNSGLLQTASQSVNNGSMVLMSTPSDLGNNEFLLWSDNGGAVNNSRETTDVPVGIQSRLNRIWRIQETGSVGTLTVKVDLSNVSGSLNLSDLRLIVDDDGIFNSGTTLSYTATSLSNRIVTFDLVDFNNVNQLYFTVGSINKNQTPLPVTFESIMTDSCNAIKWEVDNALEVKKFEICISKDLVIWDHIQTVESRDGQYQYFTVVNPDEQTEPIYVKVKAVEDDYVINSSVVYLKGCSMQPYLRLYPLPCNHVLNIKTESEIDFIEIYDDLGILIDYLSFEKSEYSLELNTSKFLDGIYCIQIKTKSGTLFTQKISVLHW